MNRSYYVVNLTAKTGDQTVRVFDNINDAKRFAEQSRIDGFQVVEWEL